ncbi:MAG: alkaline phosphatase family protein [Acidobacteriota bacterium]
MKNHDDRLLIIGLDGATWDVLGPWVEDGTLPHLARLRTRGRWAVLRSTIPPVTAPAWSSFMTGKKPGKHGVYHFVRLFEEEKATPGRQFVSARTLRSPAIWDVLGHHDRMVGLINIPLTYPPRPVNGFMITGLLTPKHASVFTYPPELSASLTDYQIDLDRFAGKTPYQDEFEDTLTSPSLEFLGEFRTMLEKRTRVCFDLIGSRPWDFFMIVFTGPDRLGHYFWKYHAPVNAGSDNPELTAGVRSYYMRLDEIVGELVERAGRDTNILVMSDHGMGPVPSKQIHIASWLQQQGWVTAWTRKSRLPGADIILARLKIGRDRVGRVIKWVPGLLNSRVVRRTINDRAMVVDPQRSMAYPVPIFFNIAGIRINATGEAARRTAVQNLERNLSRLRDPDTGEPVIREIFPGRDYYSAAPETVPDLIAVSDPRYCFKHALGYYNSVVTPRHDLRGPAKHRMEGIFMAVGRGITPKPDPLPSVHLEDIAPTALHLMGVPVPSDMDGRVLTELFSTECARSRPVAVQEPVGFWPRPDRREFSKSAMSAEDEAFIENQLRSLGYLD